MNRDTAPTALAYVGAVFVGAFLSFSVQPMVGKLLLPRYGGTPAVWNTALVVFQLLLLAGYGYAHASVTRLSVRGQRTLHLAMVIAAAIFLPPALRTATPPPTEWPILSVLSTLVLAISGPFLVLAATSTLVQSWYAAGGGAGRRDPYWLYAASNLGSLLGLVAYPLLIEPRWDLAAQTRGWAVGYALYALLILAVGRLGFRRAEPPPPPVADSSRDGNPTKAVHTAPAPSSLSTSGSTSTPAPKSWLGWVIRPAVASSLLLAVTMHISTDVAAVPMLWIIPLALYLVTFILAFSHPLGRWRWVLAMVVCVCLAAVVSSLFIERSLSLAVRLGADLAVLFFGAWLLHNDLARDRPAPAALSTYYLAISLGGAIGGILNSLVAPLIFRSVAEYPLTLAALAWLTLGRGQEAVGNGAQSPATDRHGPSGWRGKLRVLAIVGAVLIVVGTLLGYRMGWGVSALLPMPFALMLGALLLAWLPDVFRVTMALVIALLLVLPSQVNPPLDQGRSFFGVLRVGQTGDVRMLVHGTTVHGAEHMTSNRREALTYFHADGPLAKAMMNLKEEGRAAVVGLGAGSLATYGRPGQRIDFYEIDPLVETMARRYFGFLGDSEADAHVVLGDARLRLIEAPDRSYDLVLVDAFSGDSIPVHLLTREAIDLYFQKLRPGGIVVLHLTNRYLDFAPVLRGLDGTGAYQVLTSQYEATDEDQAKVHWPVHAAAIARSEADLAGLRAAGGWFPLEPGREIVWTDGFSNVLGLLRDVATTR